MNIYLDIDGVFILDEKHLSPNADMFLQHVLNKYPDSTYWLTTPSSSARGRAAEVLAPLLTPETVELLHRIKASEWNELKTDAINFEEDFLWFDDDIWPDELKVLEEHNATSRFIIVDLKKDPEILKKLIEIL